MNDIVSKLSPRELEEWRKACASRDAIMYNPEAFTAEETIQIFQSYFTLSGKLYEEYDIDDSEEWRISPYSGHIYYEGQ